MHVDNSAAHQVCQFECSVCGRDFPTEQSLHQHSSSAAGHPYCIPCRRMFMNQNNLTQHQHSRIHVGNGIHCPFCKAGFTTASGVTIHLESGNCPQSGLDRQKINTMVQRMDRNNVHSGTTSR
ncbi:hypothetical protein DL98DRAFT_468725 [Cadophora sp. DSE1049]|nr:hypothetical protein DL98DRAFT_468725 [Cadophora sp. DSE1049]